jgi:hypothetical protein
MLLSFFMEMNSIFLQLVLSASKELIIVYHTTKVRINY